jgi:Helix-turn-helix domain
MTITDNIADRGEAERKPAVKTADNQLYSEKQAAQILACSVAALRKWRLLGKGPTYVKVSRLVRYSEADLAAYLDANRKKPVAVGGVQ